ncbi:MAG: glycoside hydrolase family 43 protein [Niameybacter sp.]|uniref:glycoside hydrolase family 43 protein n=1 Tax=Niameybacter sp. TaxID=2033640 RepID=UPI002FCC7F1B
MNNNINNNLGDERVYHNPIQRGFFPDPSIVRVGEDYYMVNSTFQYFPAIAISHSRDLVHWQVIGHAITNNDDLDLSNIPDSHGIWAPDISYHDGKFYIFATLRLNGDGSRDNNVLRRQLMMVSENPEGPYSRPVSLEVDDIDPSHFIDDDGTHYMIIAAGAKIVKLSDDCTKVLSEPISAWEGTGERCSEGPHIMKKDGYYYAIVAEGGTGYGHGVNVGRSKNLLGPYENCPYNPVMRQTDPQASIQRAGHGKLVQTQKGDWWMVYLCGRPNQGNYTTVGRETALDPVSWTEDGWFIVNEGKGPSTVQTVPDLEEYLFERSTLDGFDEEKLGLEWEFVRNPDNSAWSLAERKGHMRLWTRDGQLFERRAKNTLLRREQELSYTASTKLEFEPSKDGEQAGLTCYYSTATYVRWSLCYEGGRKLQLVINRNQGEEVIQTIDHVQLGAIYLKVVVEKLTRSFYYSYDGENWTLGGVLENCIYLCDEGVPNDPKRHTGTLVGIYANNGGCGSRIPADFDWFKYED